MDVFSQLAQDVVSARARAQQAQSKLDQARSKIVSIWQQHFVDLLSQANNDLQIANVNFYLSPDPKKRGDTLVGLDFRVNGVKGSDRLSIIVDGDPDRALVSLNRGDALESVAIATSLFPREDFAAAIVSVLRQALPEIAADF